MKNYYITIKLTKKEMVHLLPTHTFYDCCDEVQTIMKKVQTQAEKICRLFKIKY